MKSWAGSAEEAFRRLESEETEGQERDLPGGGEEEAGHFSLSSAVSEDEVEEEEPVLQTSRRGPPQPQGPSEERAVGGPIKNILLHDENEPRSQGLKDSNHAEHIRTNKKKKNVSSSRRLSAALRADSKKIANETNITQDIYISNYEPARWMSTYRY